MTTPQHEEGLPIGTMPVGTVKPMINVDAKYGRLYFCVTLVRTLELDKNTFRIFKKGKRWLLSKTYTSGDLSMKCHERAFYVVSRSLVTSLTQDLKHQKPSFMVQGILRKSKHYVLTFTEPVVKKHTERRDPKVTSAERVLSRYAQTNFVGRIKTNEVIRAEHIINPGST